MAKCFKCNLNEVSEITGTWINIDTVELPICDTCTHIPATPTYSICPGCTNYRDYDTKEFCSTECASEFLDLPIEDNNAADVSFDLSSFEEHISVDDLYTHSCSCCDFNFPTLEPLGSLCALCQLVENDLPIKS